jgi:hypothetical protein
MDMTLSETPDQLSQAEKDLLKTNVPPDPAEEASIRSDLAANRRKMGDKDLTNEGKTFLSERIILQEIILSAIRRVPMEVIAGIIWEAVALEDGMDGFICLRAEQPSSEFTSTLWCCSKVCHLWRAAALSNPSLWSSLKIQIDNVTDRFLEVIEALLERSYSYPLKLCLYSSRNFQPTSSVFLSRYWFRKMMEVLVLQRQRWHTLCLQHLPNEFTEALTPFLQGSAMPSLHTFEHKNDRNTNSLSSLRKDQDPVISVVEALSGALNLRRVSMGLVALTADEKSIDRFRSLPLPWHQLESFAVSFAPMSFRGSRSASGLLLALLRKAPNVIELCLDDSDGHSWSMQAAGDDDTSKLVLLVKLRKIRICPTAIDVISALQLPNLEHIQLFIDPRRHWGPTYSLWLDQLELCSTWLTRWAPPLRTVTLVRMLGEELDYEGSIKRYAGFWESLPASVDTLRIIGAEHEEGEDSLRSMSRYNPALISSIEETKGLKNLDHLYIEVLLQPYREPVPQVLTQLLAMVRSLTSLRTFTFKATVHGPRGQIGAPPKENLQPFFDLRQGGLTVEMAFKDKWYQSEPAFD